MKRYLTVQILVGLPGVGKSHYAHLTQTINNRVKIINRDEIRCDLIARMAAESKGMLDKTDPGAALAHSNDKVFETFIKNNREIKDLDDMVTSYEHMLMRTAIKRMKPATSQKNFLIMDGCHTKWKDLKDLIDILKKIPEVYLEVYFFGDDRTQSSLEVNNKKEGDYSDYCRCGVHSAIPKSIFERKRAEYKELLTNHLKEIKSLIDYGAMDCIDIDTIVPLTEIEGHPSIHF